MFLHRFVGEYAESFRIDFQKGLAIHFDGLHVFFGDQAIGCIVAGCGQKCGELKPGM